MKEGKALAIARALREAGERPHVSFFEDTERTPRHSVELRYQYADEHLLRRCLRVAEEYGEALDVSSGAVPGAFVLRFYHDYGRRLIAERGDADG